ncbi:uncharacterized protein B0I36DRAFT_356957 [Microdochium trichocladiopsis]|nr:uncharacterized protein B0I36DRAFT_356957 [Microdochium trichocladiopsis]KAH7007830.1 hypothetical protein B0I36DRAFT_356957 [Microdochium trichocladiopsis]
MGALIMGEFRRLAVETDRFLSRFGEGRVFPWHERLTLLSVETSGGWVKHVQVWACIDVGTDGGYFALVETTSHRDDGEETRSVVVDAFRFPDTMYGLEPYSDGGAGFWHFYQAQLGPGEDWTEEYVQAFASGSWDRQAGIVVQWSW